MANFEFEINESVEINCCLGSDDFGIERSAFRNICSSRIGVIVIKNNRCEYQYRVQTSGGLWWLPVEALKKLEVQNV